jgi:hypothetical protein
MATYSSKWSSDSSKLKIDIHFVVTRVLDVLGGVHGDTLVISEGPSYLTPDFHL